MHVDFPYDNYFIISSLPVILVVAFDFLPQNFAGLTHTPLTQVFLPYPSG